jgi:hypothetical protein
MSNALKTGIILFGVLALVSRLSLANNPTTEGARLP